MPNYTFPPPAGAGAGTQYLFTSCIYVGAIPASQILVDNPVPFACTFPSGLTNSVATLNTAATAQTDFDVQKNGASFGTIRFAAAGTVASFIAASSSSFSAGDILTVVAPSSPDSTAATLGFTLTATRP